MTIADLKPQWLFAVLNTASSVRIRVVKQTGETINDRIELTLGDEGLSAHFCMKRPYGSR
jgi:hypothetical protein